MFLLDSNRSIIAKLLVAAPTTQPDFNTSYSDRTGAPQVTWTEGMNDGTLNDTNEVTIVAAPSAGNIRYVRNIQVQNPNTSQITVIFVLANGANRRIIRQIDVVAKGTVEWDSESGWLTATTMTIVNGLTSGIVTSGLIGNNAVTSGNIASGAVGQFQLSSGAVISGDIGNAAVVSGSIASGQITQSHIASGVLTSGFQDAYTTAEAISGFNVVALDHSGHIIVANAGDPTRVPAIGFAAANALSGQSISVYEGGRVNSTLFNFSGFVGERLYVGLSGGIETLTSGQGLLTSGLFVITQVLGEGISASGLMVNTEPPAVAAWMTFYESAGLSTTTSATLQDKLVMTTPAFTGRFIVFWSAEVGNQSNNSQSAVELNNITDSVTLDHVDYRSSNTNLFISCGGFTEVNFTGSAKTFKIQFSAGSGTATIQRARLLFMRRI